MWLLLQPHFFWTPVFSMTKNESERKAKKRIPFCVSTLTPAYLFLSKPCLFYFFFHIFYVTFFFVYPTTILAKNSTCVPNYVKLSRWCEGIIIIIILLIIHLVVGVTNFSYTLCRLAWQKFFFPCSYSHILLLNYHFFFLLSLVFDFCFHVCVYVRDISYT